MVTIQQVQCRHCGHRFVPRVANPKRCPNRDCMKMWPLGEPATTQPAKEQGKAENAG